eukprot:143191-Hanusia_phi.AAC.2
MLKNDGEDNERRSVKENVGQGRIEEVFFELSIQDGISSRQDGKQEGEEEEGVEGKEEEDERSGGPRMRKEISQFVSLTSSRLPRNLQLRPKSSPFLSPPQGLVSSSDLCILECLNNEQVELAMDSVVILTALPP